MGNGGVSLARTLTYFGPGASRMFTSEKAKSRFLSLVLRHKPEEIGLMLDPQGWASIEILISKVPFPLSRQELDQIVANSDKQRFALSPDGECIRANQGHSVAVELGLVPVVPPSVLFHGTARTNLVSILAVGLSRQNRHHVHLSTTHETAIAVGKRHGEPVVLVIDAAAMVQAGYVFYRSENDVWLTDTVPMRYLTVGEA